MANTTHACKKVAGAAASAKKGAATEPAKTNKLTETNALSTTQENRTTKSSSLSNEPNVLIDCSRVTRSTAQSYHHDLNQKPAFPVAAIATTGGVHYDDSSSLYNYVAKGNAFCRGVKSNTAPTKSQKSRQYYHCHHHQMTMMMLKMTMATTTATTMLDKKNH